MNLTPPQINAITTILDKGSIPASKLHKETVSALIRKGICTKDEEHKTNWYDRREVLVFVENLPEQIEHLRIAHLLKS